MSKRYFKHIFILMMALAITAPAWATNGTNLIGVGPVSRSMGGVGVAAPQDALSAIFANPAGMCFGEYCPGSEFVFGGTIFSPTVKGTVNGVQAESQMDPSVIPAVGVSTPINPKWRFGIGAYGVSGMGVDYKVNGWPSPPFGPLFTKLEVMKFAPNIAYLINDNFSVGANISISYQNLDLGEGGNHGYGYGAQLGLIYKIGKFSLGASYTSPSSVTHNNVTTYGGTNPYSDLELESPAVYAGGIAWEPNKKFLLEFDVKFLPWSSAAGYKDFDWEDQTVYAIGAQYRVTPKIALRAGYNYGNNPVKENNGWNPAGTTNVQGATVPTLLYETFRVLGFPAVVEQHATLGLGWKVTDTFIIDLSLMHAFEQEINETSAGSAFTFKSTLEETSTSLGLTWRF